ncbi:MAG TPA: hypothetical protein VFL36_06120 [Myxococcales bacterium]|nr:hypothetical protein [Myxococcales bacterium]
MSARTWRRASRPLPRTGTRAPVWAACALVAIGLGFAAVHLLAASDEAPLAAVEPEAQAAPRRAPPPSILRESGPRLTQGRLPPPEMKPLFDPNMRLNLGETTTLRFAAPNAEARDLASSRGVTASVFHRSDPERQLPVREVENGVYEVPFQPYGPGQFQVVLNVGGVPAGTQKVGVIGAAGRADATVDIVDPLLVDPRDFRARTGGQFHRR